MYSNLIRLRPISMNKMAKAANLGTNLSAEEATS